MYELPIVRNDSTVPLADFFWRDMLPTNAARVDRLVTGTFNHALRYRIIATTNRGNELVVADNLSTTSNNVVELRPVHLGLAADEYLTEFTVHFGQVPAGFTAVERPRIYMDVLSESQTLLPSRHDVRKPRRCWRPCRRLHRMGNRQRNHSFNNFRPGKALAAERMVGKNG